MGKVINQAKQLVRSFNLADVSWGIYSYLQYNSNGLLNSYLGLKIIGKDIYCFVCFIDVFLKIYGYTKDKTTLSHNQNRRQGAATCTLHCRVA